MYCSIICYYTLMSGELLTQRVRGSAMAFAMAGSLILGGCVESGHTSKQTNSASAESSPFTGAPQQCIEPTIDEINTADHLLRAPEDPLASIPVSVSQRGSDYEDQMAKYADFLKQTAAEDHVTIFDGAPAANNIYHNLAGMKPAPESFATYLTEVQQFLDQLGVTLTVAEPGVTYSYGGRVPTAEELATKSAAYLLADIATAFSNLPKEYVELAGLKHIIIVAGTDTEDVAGYANTEYPHDTIVLDILKTPDQSISPSGVNHELYHLIDAASCGAADMFNDHGFVALNGDRMLYSNVPLDTRPTYPSYKDSFTTEQNNDTQMLVNANQQADNTLRCQIVSQELSDQAEVVTVSDYHPNPAEDKAEIGSVIPNTNDYVEFDNPQYATLYPKFRYLLARLYHQNPGIVRFFAKTSRRPMEDPLRANC